jgi:hypothetical protein
MVKPLDPRLHEALQRGMVIPACPLVLSTGRTLDEARQRRLARYYVEAGAGGLAVGVHTTQFAIREPRHGLLLPVLELIADELDRADIGRDVNVVRIAGVCGQMPQAMAEASLARELRYHAALLSLTALRGSSEDALIAHCRLVSEVLPLFGFYLQPDVGGIELPLSFWRRFAEIEGVVAIKIAPFNRYRTLDVVRAVIETGRDDIALYTGNDDNIVLDLLTPFRFEHNGQIKERRIVGGLLGQWAVWTRQAVTLLGECHRVLESGGDIPLELLALGAAITDANGVIFDAANGFSGCLPGIHEVLRRQGLLNGTWCLDPDETLSPGQSGEIDRILLAYPHLTDDSFVREFLKRWSIE